MKTQILIFIVSLAISSSTLVAQEMDQNPSPPKGKQTSLELYVTSKEAYEKWKAAPDKVHVLDVRTPEEYIYIGHPEMAWNIPLALQTYKWNETRESFAMRVNPDFLNQVKEVVKPDDTILMICRSGGRSAKATNLLAAAGFKNVYNVIDGVEGDTVKDPESQFNGQRMKNGWKNSGLPWTYKVDRDQMKLPTDTASINDQSGVANESKKEPMPKEAKAEEDKR